MEFISCRAIIIRDKKLVVMRREKNGKKYCTFPGGHVEGNESGEECVKREVLEEFGINIEPVRLIYVYEFRGEKQGFFVSKWVSGEIHITNAEEYQQTKYGTYNPDLIEIVKINEESLMPPEIARQFIFDYNKYGENLIRPLIYVKADN